jgi:hypothetical protein
VCNCRIGVELEVWLFHVIARHTIAAGESCHKQRRICAAHELRLSEVAGLVKVWQVPLIASAGYQVVTLLFSFFSIEWASVLSFFGILSLLVAVAAAFHERSLDRWKSMHTGDWIVLLIALALIAVLNPFTMWHLAPVLFHKETGLLTPLFGKETPWVGLSLFYWSLPLAFFFVVIIGGIVYFIADRSGK